MSNLRMLHAVAQGLDYLLEKVVFVGGSVTELYATDGAATEVRPTDDVDCVIELLSYSEFHKLEDKLRKLNFQNDTEDGVISRWIYKGLKVDIMPDDDSILGFTNEWYKKGIAYTNTFTFDDGTQIRYFQTAYFIASKLVALASRGGNDLRTSSDFEDIVYILDNRTGIISELEKSNTDVLEFLKTESAKLISNKALEESIACVLPYNSGGERIKNIINLLKEIVNL